MGDIFTLGPLIIKKSWLLLGLSITCGYLVYYYYLRKRVELREEINGLFTSALFWFLITWKLSPLLFRTSIFINDPIVLLYYRPGDKETILALVITLGFMLYKVLRLNLSFYIVFNALMLISSVAAFCYYFFIEEKGIEVQWSWLATIFAYHPLHIYYMALFLLLTIGWLSSKYELDSPKVYRSYLSLISVGQLGISLLKPYPYMLGIQTYLFWLIVLIIGLSLEWLYRFLIKRSGWEANLDGK